VVAVRPGPPKSIPTNLLATTSEIVKRGQILVPSRLPLRKALEKRINLLHGVGPMIGGEMPVS
jgi:hypothetical protein